MARMYSRKKGKSSSKKPLKKSMPSWMGYKAKEVEIIISKLAKEEKTTSEIGLVMRDVYGIPDVRMLVGKKISQILAEKKLLGELPEDILSLIRKASLVRKHLEENHKDMPAKRGLQLTESKIKRLAKYYKNKEKIPLDWRYDPKNTRFYIS